MDLHRKIMNLQCNEDTASWWDFSNRRIAYKEGHRAARHAAAELVLAALAEAEGQVVQGWKLVPVEPTIDMLAAAERELDRHEWNRLDDRLWTAMLAAAPEAPAQRELLTDEQIGAFIRGVSSSAHGIGSEK